MPQCLIFESTKILRLCWSCWNCDDLAKHNLHCTWAVEGNT